MDLKNIIKLADLFTKTVFYKIATITPQMIENLKKECLANAKTIVDENISEILAPLYTTNKIAMQKPERILDLYIFVSLPIIEQNYDYQHSKVVIEAYVDKIPNKDITDNIAKIGINTQIKNIMVQSARNKFPGSEVNLPSISISNVKFFSMNIV